MAVVTIHPSDPFATPDDQRSPARRLRGRLAAPVTLWTARSESGPAGLTVSSVLVADGTPGQMMGIIDEESDLWTAVRQSGHFAMICLGATDQQLADRFAGLMPAPGGLFTEHQWRQTPYGPVLEGARTWAGCRLDRTRRFGWGLLVEATLDDVTIGTSDGPALVHLRGRYHEIP